MDKPNHFWTAEHIATMDKLANPARRRLFRGKIKPQNLLRLPWVLNEQTFIEHCTQCQDCIKACDTQIITKDEQGYPKIDFNLGECTFCQKCNDVCQQPLFIIDKSTKAWPGAVTISEKCLAKNSIYCQSCRDECEPTAIKFRYIDSSIPQPVIDKDSCTQCGACISSCPQNAIAFNLVPNEISNA